MLLERSLVVVNGAFHVRPKQQIGVELLGWGAQRKQLLNLLPIPQSSLIVRITGLDLKCHEVSLNIWLEDQSLGE